MLKETVSLRPFFLAPKTFVKIDGFKNIYNFLLKIFFIEIYEAPFTFRNSTGTEVPAFTFGQTGSSVSTCSTSPYVLVNSIIDIGNIQHFYSSYSIRALRHSPWQADKCVFGGCSGHSGRTGLPGDSRIPCTPYLKDQGRRKV